MTEKIMQLLHSVMLADAKDLVVIITVICLAAGRKYLLNIKNAILKNKLISDTRFISDQLAILCGVLEADRTLFYVFKGEVATRNKNLVAFCTHEAIRAGFSSYMEQKSEMCLADYDPFLETLLTKQFVMFSDIGNSNNPPLQSTLSGRGVVSIANYLVKNTKGKVVGFIAVEYVHRKASSTETEIRKNMLHCASTIGSTIKKNF